MRHILLAAAALCLPATAHAQLLDAPKCAIDKATYRMKDNADYLAGFTKLAHGRMTSDLLFWIKSPKRTWWFGFESPNGYGGTWLSPSLSAAMIDEEDMREDGEQPQAFKDWDESAKQAGDAPDPLQNITFDAFNPDLTAFSNPPQSEDPAPARIFMRGIGQALWYSYTWAAAGDPKAEQESIPTAMWEPAGCAK
ncbi:MAG: hypothetical protein KF730_02235 [Sphingomonas sp.]|uniref:hypothetical protein n=1 Tax=Sphingomonas sp. TaxID=28214 RepID=UPI0025FC47E8|nr:hypothetical protein [Sphingomonas sp.]MBX3563373.1 hypothetical protein [Sphingomonas sp.]